jgi:hypothetical protein
MAIIEGSVLIEQIWAPAASNICHYDDGSYCKSDLQGSKPNFPLLQSRPLTYMDKINRCVPVSLLQGMVNTS